MTTWIQDNGGGTITIESLDDIDDGVTYVKSHNDFTDTLKTKLDGIDTGASDDQTGDEMVTAINASAGGLDLDKTASGTTNKVLTANEKTGADRAYNLLDTTGIQAGATIDGAALTLNQVADKADDSLQKSTDDLDDVSNGATYGKVRNDNLTSGNVSKLYDGASLRAVGTAENEIPLLGVGGRLPASRLEGEVVVLNGGGTLERANGSAITLDDMTDGSSSKSVPTTETKRIVLWQSSTENRATGAVTYDPYKETSVTFVRKIAIPYLHSADVQTLEIKAWMRNTTGGSTAEAKLSVHTIDTSTGEPLVFTTAAGATIGVTGSTWDTVEDDFDVTALTPGTHYAVVISMQASANQAEMDFVMIAKNVLVVE